MTKQEKFAIAEVEEWRPVLQDTGENKYEVSSFGRLRRALERPRISGTKWRYLNSYSDPKHEYIQAWLGAGVGKNPIRTQVHRLVAEAFIGPRPPDKFVNHIDGVRTNNRADNLEYVTAQENTAHAMRIGLHQPGTREYPNGSRSGSSKLNSEEVKKVKELIRSGMRSKEIACLIGRVGESTINAIRYGKSWRHVG